MAPVSLSPTLSAVWNTCTYILMLPIWEEKVLVTPVVAVC